MDAEALAESGQPPSMRRGASLGLAALRSQIARALLGVASASCAAASVLMLWLYPQAGDVGALFALLSLLSLPLMRLPPALSAHALTAVLLLVMTGIAYAAVVFGWGPASPGLAVFGLLACIVCTTVGVAAGTALAAVAAAITVAVAFLTPAAASSGASLALQVGAQVIGILSGLAAGIVVARIVKRHSAAAKEREERFGRLLALAADVYWELDEHYRLVGTAEHSAGPCRLKEPCSQPWNMPRMGWDADALDALRADLEAHEPFRDLRVTWGLPDGGQRVLLASGEPRFDERGIFRGYWGVARDITEMQATRNALQATETRYQDLFLRIPTPLVLHRDGHVVDANPAALALFGCTEPQDLIGSDLLESYEAGDSRERERGRIESLNHEPMGTALPVADFRLQLAGRTASVRATGVRVDAEGGAAVLAIFVDDSERRIAEEAVRRSEALLSHLVATSPDLITLTEVASGRYAMVNQAFERVSGWTAAEAIGRTALELGIWGADSAARERFVALLRAQGMVSDLPVSFVTKSGAAVRMQVSAARFVMDRRDYMVINARDVTERERGQQALARARDAAEAANRAKSAFLANTSHELRTPLNGIIGLARLARSPDIPDERRRQYLDQIADSAQALAGIISDILDLSKIEAGKLHIEDTLFDLGEQMRALQQTYVPLAQSSGLGFAVDLAPAVGGTVRGDPLRLRQIVGNFIDNALKFTARGEVRVTVTRAEDGSGRPGERVRIEVHDTGPGIDGATRARLFTPFTQADQSTTRRYGGTGLGLSICRELARLMGGEVGVESEPDAGSRFWAELPLPRAAARPADAGPVTESSASLHGMHVLLVEDNAVNMMIGVAMLERWGVAVEQATDGRAAVVAVQRAAAAGRPFDAVLMDVQMPVMSGHEATRSLRTSEVGRTLPIIALTAAALVSERDEAMAAGMNDFLTKPIDADKLREALARWSSGAI